MGALKAENEALRARVAELEARTAMATATANKQAVGGLQPRSPTGASSGSVPLTNDHTNSGGDGGGSGSGDGGSGGGGGEDACRSSLGKAGMTAAEIARYSRHLLVPAVGVEGQR